MSRSCAAIILLSLVVPSLANAQSREAERLNDALMSMAGLVADALERDAAKTVAVVEFGGAPPTGGSAIVPGGSAGAFGRWFASAFTDHLAQAARRRFTVVERSRVDRLLEEQELALSGLASTEGAINAGELLVCQALVFGTVMADDERSARVSVRVVDAETGAVLDAFPRRVAMTSDVAALLGMERKGDTLAELSIAGRSPFGMRVIAGGKAKAEHVSGDDSWVLAKPGERYGIELRNDSDRRVGVALYVDGINSIYMRRELPSAGLKWVLEPRTTVIVPGWQADLGTAREFFFSGKAESLAASIGYLDELGIISASFYPETASPSKGEAGTGVGGAFGNEVREVRVMLESVPAEIIVIKYDYKKGLEAKGIAIRE
jgi:curli biogenesis system outer membrane secretion channel CsgG